MVIYKLMNINQLDSNIFFLILSIIATLPVTFNFQMSVNLAFCNFADLHFNEQENLKNGDECHTQHQIQPLFLLASVLPAICYRS